LGHIYIDGRIILEWKTYPVHNSRETQAVLEDQITKSRMQDCYSLAKNIWALCENEIEVSEIRVD